MEEKKIVRRDKKDITDNKAKQKKILFGISIFIFVIAYVFLLTMDTDKKMVEELTESDTVVPTTQVVKSEKNLAPTDGGTINLSVSRFGSVNPLKNKEKSLDDVFRLVYDSLFEFDSDYNLQNEIATGYSFNADTTQLKVQLNSDVKWHDGTRLTGSDVEYTINFIKKNPESPYSYLVTNIESVTGYSNSVEIKLKTSNSLEANNLIFPIISQKSEKNIKAVFNDEDFGVVGNGMYKIVDYKKGKQFVLKKNENYSGKKPYIENICVKIFDNKEIRQNMFIASNVDIVDSDYYELSKYQYDIFKTQAYESRKFEAVAFNTSKPPFDQKANRIEIASILEREKMAEDAYRGILNLNLMPINTKSELNLATENIHSVPKDKMKEAANNKFKEKLVIVTDKDDPMKHRLAYMIKNQIETLGISPEVEVRAVSKAKLKDIILAKNYNILIMEYKIPVDKDVTKIMNKYSTIFGYNAKELNLKMKNIKANSSKIKMMQDYKKLQEEIIQAVPFIGIGYKNDYIVVNKKIEGKLKPTEFEIYNGIENIYIPN
ncbi:MAG: ABC transporter substrate-binding protein [Proteocatella sp.]